MKKISDLMNLIERAIKQNNENKHWFISFSGHVNLLEVRLYPNGWHSEIIEEKEAVFVTNKCYFENEESVQELYYWIYFNLDEI